MKEVMLIKIKTNNCHNYDDYDGYDDQIINCVVQEYSAFEQISDEDYEILQGLVRKRQSGYRYFIIEKSSLPVKTIIADHLAQIETARVAAAQRARERERKAREKRERETIRAKAKNDEEEKALLKALLKKHSGEIVSDNRSVKKGRAIEV